MYVCIAMLKDTHNFDVVIPNNNEQEFISLALALGYKEIVFLSTNMNYTKPKSDLIGIRTAYLLKEVSEISRAKRNFDYVFAVSERKFFESKIDFMINTEFSDRKDSFHYRSTGFNQVHAELSKRNDISIVFNFGSLFLNSRTIFGRMLQNASLVKKYSLGYATFSLAKHPLFMRSKDTLTALERVLKI
jgi:hypothetical protein